MNREEARSVSCHLGLCTLTVLIGAMGIGAREQSLPQDMLGGGRLAPEKWSAGCGIDSLYLGLRIIGVDADYFDLIERAEIERPEQWVNLGTLWRLTRELGAQGLAVKIEGEKETELRRLLHESTPRAAILHLRAYEDRPEHLACAFLSRKGEIQIAGGTTFQPEVAKTWRKRWSGAALLLARKPFQKGTPAVESAPRIDFDKTVLDFNKVPNSGRFDYSFQIKNLGDSILHIEGVLPSCSCSKPELASNTVLPGDSVAVTGNVGVGTEPGPGEGKLTVVSDDPKRPRVEIALKWTVGPPLVQLDPRSITMADMLPGSRDDTFVRLDFREGTSIEPNDIGIVVHPDWIDATLLPDGRTLKITVSPTWPAGKQLGRAVLTVESSKSRVVLPIEVEVTPTIIVTPARLFCAREPGKQYVTKEIGLCPATDKDAFEVLDTTIHNIPGHVTARKDPQKPHGWNLEVRLGPFGESTPPFLVGHIAVRTSHGNVAEIQIPAFVN